jgi:hypothetical protein
VINTVDHDSNSDKKKSPLTTDHENELCLVLPVYLTEQDCLLPGREYEELRSL